MSRITDDQLTQRLAKAQLKTAEAKANLWSIAGFVATVGTIGGMLVLIALFFKVVFG